MKIVLLYGPPSSGKGTHARLLNQVTHFPIIEPAVLFRAIAADPKHKWYTYIGEKINNGYPTPTDAYMILVKEAIEPLLKSGTSFIMDKPGGSLLPETEWFLEYIKPFDAQVFLCVLDITLAESLRRIESRYFITSTGQSFITYEEALSHCPPGEIPVKRVDDLDSQKAERRYKLLFADQKDQVIQLFKKSGAQVVILNGMDPILTVQDELRKIVM
jgi:adenylate kinase family enzyme